VGEGKRRRGLEWERGEEKERERVGESKREGKE
jgi:hypothetical protein